MKIVYNSCYGGFSLSLAAEKLYLEKKGYAPIFHKGKSSWDQRWYCKEMPDFYCRDIERDDPDLAAVVEELGDLANGECAKLRIAEVPKGTAYRIEEYDGNESVMTSDDYDWSFAK